MGADWPDMFISMQICFRSKSSSICLMNPGFGCCNTCQEDGDFPAVAITANCGLIQIPYCPRFLLAYAGLAYGDFNPVFFVVVNGFDCRYIFEAVFFVEKLLLFRVQISDDNHVGDAENGVGWRLNNSITGGFYAADELNLVADEPVIHAQRGVQFE